VYLTADVGVRSEVNGWVGDGEVLITPSDYQKDLFIV
jgi:hypothetical protein